MYEHASLHVGLLCELFLTGWSGVERMFAGLAAGMMARGHRVTLIARPPAGKLSTKLPLTPVPEGCGLLHMGPDDAEGWAATKAALRELDLDVLVAPCAGRRFLRVPALLADTGIPLVSAESFHPAAIAHERWNAYEYFACLTACDRVQVLVEDFLPYYPQALHSRIDVIGNPAPPPQPVDWGEREAKSNRTLLAVGRFSERDKRYTQLLRAWSLLAPEFPDWSLTMVGDGPDWHLYQAMAQAMGLDARITFTGGVADPSPYYTGADLFCIPSRGEGLPLVLLEAAAHSLPLVGVRDCDGVRAVIGPDRGALAEDGSPAALAEALRPLMAASPEERRRLGENAQAFIQANYGAEHIYDQWEACLLEAAAHRGFTRLDQLQRDRWNEALLREAALEVLSRPDPTGGPAEEGSGAALARLRDACVALERENQRLQTRYDGLLRQLSGGKKNGRR